MPPKDGRNFQKYDGITLRCTSTLEYYIRADQLLNSYKFHNKYYKKIWELHSTGMTEREISKHVKRYKKSAIHWIIAKIAAYMIKEMEKEFLIESD